MTGPTGPTGGGGGSSASPFIWTEVVDPQPGGTSINNYNPPSLATLGIIAVKPAGGSVTLTGLLAQAVGRVIIITNVGSGDLILTNQDPASVAANRFLNPFNDDVTIAPTGAMAVFYDSNSSRWRSASMSSTMPELTLTAGPLVAPSAIVGQFSYTGDPLQASLKPADFNFGQVRFTGASLIFLSVGGTISPAALPIGTTNNYAPVGITGAVVIRQASNAGNSALSGIDSTAGATINPDGQVLYIYNISGGTLTLLHNDAGSAVGNRFLNAGGAPKVLTVGQMAMLVYDNTSGAWRASLMT